MGRAEGAVEVGMARALAVGGMRTRKGVLGGRRNGGGAGVGHVIEVEHGYCVRASRQGGSSQGQVSRSITKSVRPSVSQSQKSSGKKKFVRLIRPQRRFIPITKTTTPLLIPVYILTNMYS